MKKNVFLILASLFGLTLSAQTNTFPLKGNVGIGTTSPSAWFNDSPLLHITGSRPTISLTQTEKGGYTTIQWKGLTSKSEFHMNFVDGANSSLAMHCYQNPAGSGVPILALRGNGNVGIGTMDPRYRLEVKGEIRGTTFSAVSPPSWPDFVFEKDYELRSLEALESYIAKNKHLPGIPSEAEVKENGLNLVDMNTGLLQKVEELTLYIIDQHKQIREQHKKIEALERKVNELSKK